MYLLSCSNVLVALLIHLWLDMAGEIFYGVDNATVHCEHLDMVLYFTLHEISSMRPKDDGHKHDMELIQIVFITHTLILFFQLCSLVETLFPQRTLRGRHYARNCECQRLEFSSTEC